MSLSLTDRSLKFLRIFRVALLFSFQGSVHAADKLIPIRTMPYDDLSSNGEGGIWTLAPLLTTCTLSRGVPSASWVLLQKPKPLLVLDCCERRGWDSNPRALADKRFSRPPRYDHFDTSPRRAPLVSARIILTNMPHHVNLFFYIIFRSVPSFKPLFCKNPARTIPSAFSVPYIHCNIALLKFKNRLTINFFYLTLFLSR